MSEQILLFDPPAPTAPTAPTGRLCPHDGCGRQFRDDTALEYHLVHHRRTRRAREGEAAAARAAGIVAAAAGADPAALEALRLVVLSVAARGPFTADDVWDYVEQRDVLKVGNPSALGPVIRELARAGTIVRTGRQVRTRIARRHRDLVEWAAPGTPGAAEVA